MRILPTVQFTHKNIALILFATILVGGAFALAEFKNKKIEKVVYSAPLTAASADALSSELQDIDADNDGLKDWEEVLLGTDPDKADTDLDGTTDGKEATSGRNPLVKGPNDKEEAVKSAMATKTLTQTEKIARDFFARYMELNQSGLTTDADSKAALVNEVIRDGIVLEKPKVFTLNDLIMSYDDSVESVRKYGNAVGNLFKTYSNPAARNELLIAKESLEAEDPELLLEIDPIIATYQNILNGFLNTPVPTSLADNHLLFINSLNTLLFSAKSLRDLDKDTIKGIQGTTSWSAGGEGLISAFQNLKTAFNTKGIVFTATEDGSFFKPI